MTTDEVGDGRGQADGSGAKAEDGRPASKERQGDSNRKEAEPDKHPVRKAKWPWVAGSTVIVGFIAFVLLNLYLPRPDQETDDAYVRAYYAMIAPRVSGQVVAVDVEDNQPVRRGDLLVAIDPSDYRATLARAVAQEAADSAQISRAQAGVIRQPALIDQADAQLMSARAARTLADKNARRDTNLAFTGAGSQQQRQTSDAQQRQAEALVDQAVAAVRAAHDQLEALQADRNVAEARVEADKAQVRLARLNLSYARVVAPIDGMIAERSVQVGDYVSPGAAVMAVVPLNRVYVEANYLEPALRHMLPGQHARIHVDAYDIWLDGIVQGVGAASGASFSPIPPDNATGNFTKIVQRLPVRITLEPNQPLARLLRVGMSVETHIDTHLAHVVADQARTETRVVSP